MHASGKWRGAILKISSACITCLLTKAGPARGNATQQKSQGRSGLPGCDLLTIVQAFRAAADHDTD